MKMCTFDFWHGTSAHFLPSIAEYGLGGCDIMKEWGAMDFLKSAFLQLDFDDTNVDDNNVSVSDYCDLLSIRSAVNGGAAGMNFVYGDVYVAGGYEKALEYAKRGPELLHFSKRIDEIADSRGVPSIRTTLAEYPKVENFISNKIEPVVLKLPRILLKDISAENGSPAESLFDTDSPMPIQMVSQVAFRLHKIIPLSDMEVFRL